MGESLCVDIKDEEVHTMYEVTPVDSAAELNRSRISTPRSGIGVANHKNAFTIILHAHLKHVQANSGLS